MAANTGTLGNTFASLSRAMDSVAIGRHIDLDSIAVSLRSLPPAATARNPLTDGQTGRNVPSATARHSGLARSQASLSPKKTGANRAKASRCLTTSYCNRRQHWWKVCWIYNGSHLLQRSQCIGTKPPDVSNDAVRTLPRHFRLSSQSATDANYLHNPKSEPKSYPCSSRLETPTSGSSSINSGSSAPGTCNKSTSSSVSPQVLTESKSMSTLETKPQSLFSFPSHLRLVDKITLHKEMARFCSQQLNPSQLLPHRIAQPLAIWAKSKAESSGSEIADLLNQHKGANWRHQQLQYQMPIHDAELFRQPTAEGRFIRNKQRKALVKSELFLTQHPSETCHKCKQFLQVNVASVKIVLPDWPASGQSSSSIKNGASSSTPKRNQPSEPATYHYYHLDCFTCFECEQILVDLKAYLHPVLPSDGHHQVSELSYNLFCCRHFVEIYKPRCPYCDHLILDEECTEAEGKAWHIGHFCCTECKRSLGGLQYIMASAEKKEATGGTAGKQLPYCLTCFDILYGEFCEECGELIGCEVGAIIHEGRSWHATDRCFRCSLCLKTLLGNPFLPANDGKIYCSLACSHAMKSHQKEKLRRQNKLHTLHSHKNSSLLNKPTEPVMDHKAENGSANGQASASKTIKEHRDQFLKSMTLSRYEQKVKNSQKDYEKIKALNLSQLVNYEQFIKHNNQFFTSKYDWSKEQEFVNTIDSNNEMCSSQTTATLSDDHNSEDNSLAHQLLSKCELTSSECSNSLERKSPPYFSDPVSLPFHPPHHAHYSLPSSARSHKTLPDCPTVAPLSATQSTTSSQNSDIRFPLTANSLHFTSPHINAAPTYYFAEKTSSLNSPSSSNETTPSWAISPPPEYSKLGDVDENSSVSSTSQNLPKDASSSSAKSPGILKISSKSLLVSGTPNRKLAAAVAESAAGNSSPAGTSTNSDTGSFQPTASPSAYLQSTPLNGTTLRHGGGTYQQTASNLVDSSAKQSATKSVSFDPNIEDKDETQRRYIRRIRTRYERAEHDDCSDSHSCSSCSTCSSSSSDDEDGFDFDFTDNTHRPERAENAGPGSGSDACTIS